MVIIVAEKDVTTPPPAYTASAGVVPESSSQVTSTRANKFKLTALPPYILLHIIYQTLPQTDGRYFGESRRELQRKALYWMSISLRLVNRALYIS